MEDNEEVIVADVELSEEDEASFDESWDEDSVFDAEGSDSEGEPEPESAEESEDAQPETEKEPDDEEETEPESEASESGKGDEAGNQRFKINYLGKEEELTLEQMTELAQKGRDYDHVRQERDQLKTASSGNDRKMAFLEKLAKRSGLSVEEQMDRTEALWLQVDSANEGNEISEEEALNKVRANRTSTSQASEGKTDEPEAKLTNENIDRFLSVYPDVRGEDIPKEVWENCAKLGGDLLSAYQAYEIKQLRSERASQSSAQRKEEQNQKNENRSTGPRRTAGSANQMDSFDEGWGS